MGDKDCGCTYDFMRTKWDLNTVIELDYEDVEDDEQFWIDLEYYCRTSLN